MRMMRPKGHGAKQNPVYDMWLLTFSEAYLIMALFHRSPKKAPAATYFWKDCNFQIIPIILGENYFRVIGFLSVSSVPKF
jgi:hypothetical protein